MIINELLIYTLEILVILEMLVINYLSSSVIKEKVNEILEFITRYLELPSKHLDSMLTAWDIGKYLAFDENMPRVSGSEGNVYWRNHVLWW